MGRLDKCPDYTAGGTSDFKNSHSSDKKNSG